MEWRARKTSWPSTPKARRRPTTAQVQHPYALAWPDVFPPRRPHLGRHHGPRSGRRRSRSRYPDGLHRPSDRASERTAKRICRENGVVALCNEAQAHFVQLFPDPPAPPQSFAPLCAAPGHASRSNARGAADCTSAGRALGHSARSRGPVTTTARCRCCSGPRMWRWRQPSKSWPARRWA